MNALSAPVHGTPNPAAVIDPLLRMPQTCAAIGRRRSKVYEDITAGTFMRPVKIGHTSVWPQSEVAAIIAARKAGKSDDQVRELVRRLMAARRAEHQ